MIGLPALAIDGGAFACAAMLLAIALHRRSWAVAAMATVVLLGFGSVAFERWRAPLGAWWRSLGAPPSIASSTVDVTDDATIDAMTERVGAEIYEADAAARALPEVRTAGAEGEWRASWPDFAAMTGATCDVAEYLLVVPNSAIERVGDTLVVRGDRVLAWSTSPLDRWYGAGAALSELRTCLSVTVVGVTVNGERRPVLATTILENGPVTVATVGETADPTLDVTIQLEVRPMRDDAGSRALTIRRSFARRAAAASADGGTLARAIGVAAPCAEGVWVWLLPDVLPEGRLRLALASGTARGPAVAVQRLRAWDGSVLLPWSAAIDLTASDLALEAWIESEEGAELARVAVPIGRP